jgi:DNA-directed RNA polymerase subunit RPC12/RpoP
VIIRLVIALAIGLSVFWLGRTALRAATAGSPRPRDEGPPEDVEDLDVFFVCAECGTEFQVTRLGDTQVPRHCGEKMQVVRRPRQAPPASLN